MEEILRMAYYLAEGHTIQETAREFRCNEKTVQRKLKRLKAIDSRLYEKAVSKYLRAVRAVLEQKTPIDQVFRKFKISRQKFYEYLEKELKIVDKQKYVIITYKLYLSKR